MSSHPEPPTFFPPHLIPFGCPRAPALSALLHASNLHWSSVLHMVIYMFSAILSNHPTLTFSHIVQKSVLYICVSFVVLHMGRGYSLSKFHIYVLIYFIGVSLSTSLCIIGSSFIYLIRMDLNVFLFIAE